MDSALDAYIYNWTVKLAAKDAEIATLRAALRETREALDRAYPCLDSAEGRCDCEDCLNKKAVLARHKEAARAAIDAARKRA